MTTERIFLLTRNHIVPDLKEFSKQTVSFSMRKTARDAIRSLNNLTGCGIVIRGEIVYDNMRNEDDH